MATRITGQSSDCCTPCSAADLLSNTITLGSASPLVATIVDMLFSEPVIITSFVATNSLNNPNFNITASPATGEPAEQHIYRVFSSVSATYTITVKWKNSSGRCKGKASSTTFTFG